MRLQTRRILQKRQAVTNNAHHVVVICEQAHERFGDHCVVFREHQARLSPLSISR